MAKQSRMQRTLDRLRTFGGMAEKTEHYLAHAKRANGGYGKRKDLFGMADIVYLPLQGPITAIQVCGEDLGPHIEKMRATVTPASLAWLQCGGAVQIWAWRKRKAKKGSKAEIFKLTVIEVTRDWLLFE